MSDMTPARRPVPRPDVQIVNALRQCWAWLLATPPRRLAAIAVLLLMWSATVAWLLTQGAYVIMALVISQLGALWYVWYAS